MSIAFVVNMQLDCFNNGPSVHIIGSIIEECARSGERVIVCSHKSDYQDNDYISLMKNLYDIEHILIEHKGAEKKDIVGRYLSDYRYYRDATRALCAREDVASVFVQSCTNPAAAVYWTKRHLRNARCMYNVQDIYSEAAVCRGLVKRTSLVFKIARRLERYAYNNSDVVTTASPDMRDTIIDTGASSDNIVVIYNWAAKESLQAPADARVWLSEKAGLTADVFKVVYAGNIGALQGVEFLVEAASNLRDRKDIAFVIVGDGVRREDIGELAKSYQLENIVFMERQSQEVAGAIYAAADANVISLVPGVTRAALPSKTAACLASGTPIVLAVDDNSKYAALMAESGNCMPCRPGDGKALSDAILAILDKNGFEPNPQGAKGLAERCFSQDKNCKQYVQILRHSE